MTSIVIPAHNEERVIGRLLDSLLDDPADDRTDIVVVCNGCTDDTARIASERGPRVTVVEIPVPSKHAALRAGDDHALGFPRIYVDADVVLTGADVRALAEPLADGASGILATAPERHLPLAGCAWRVRAYYQVWQRLPAVREGLFGRGVIAVSKEGHARIAALPPLMADDLAASLAFTAEERRVVGGARVVVHPPRTWRDLIKRRIRAMVSTAQVEEHRGPEEASARTSTADLKAMLRGEPKLITSVVVFAAAAVVSRRRAQKAIRARDFDTWLRDDSSRQN
ncbi:glycosyltransferase family 2 protein [Streptomyces justiciae]|uniref:glycosyltransferase n=1 Tax=Streptomyces justiciae TaxID=2780140 RepID=UPI001880320F|nr:glycosyltransferase family 2 protein [Streptomyces justiciae]MBE8470411.1 glycosyltransferase family 2 protein [Streptomyces justiciae]MCW8376643.1 glycosyltransferase [Streptomyces justiciae]